MALVYLKFWFNTEVFCGLVDPSHRSCARYTIFLVLRFLSASTPPLPFWENTSLYSKERARNLTRAEHVKKLSKALDVGPYCIPYAECYNCPKIGPGCPSECVDCIPRAHFDELTWGLVTCFQILSGENWNTVMSPKLRSSICTQAQPNFSAPSKY